MAKVDPRDKQWDSGGGTGGGERKKPEPVRPGKKLLAATGQEHYTSQKGTPMVSIRFVVLYDYEKVGDEGREIFENFCAAGAGLAMTVRFARAIGYHEPFDPEIADDVEKVMMSGYVVGRVEMDSWQGKERPRVKYWDPCPGSTVADPAWDAVIAQSEANHVKYLEWRHKNPRGAGFGGGGSGRVAAHPDDGGGYDDPVPF
ncbi:MAG: hypothetical protein KGS10_05700 [Chloroflexi bacterium]|nr:hypothetical protein [Chloroflexota bacterium]